MSSQGDLSDGEFPNKEGRLNCNFSLNAHKLASPTPQKAAGPHIIIMDAVGVRGDSNTPEAHRHLSSRAVEHHRWSNDLILFF